MSNSKVIKKYNEAFIKMLNQLNDEQRVAVNQIEGPVLVIAGPGTGKTHILTARIGRILMETDAQAHNILCLTFTDAGAHAMRQRLLEFIGPEAHRVHIYTFHSFCNSVIQDNLDSFGHYDLEPLSDLERIEIIRKLIDTLSDDHPLKRGKRDPYFYESQLYDLFKRMKSEDWSVQFMNEQIDVYVNDLPTRKEFIYQVNRGDIRKGELKKAKIEDATEKMDRLRSAVALFPVYTDLMTDARRYDFDDMILWVLRAFEKNEALLRHYQEQYLYFLIDEYQDTNGSQNNIIHKLIEYWENPNIFIVGDDDQSIFEFQGARLKSLLDFHQDFQDDLKLVLLRENYRSTQHILDTAKSVVDNNQNRIVNVLEGLEKSLKASNKTFADLPVKPEIIAYKNRLHENTDIVTQIEQLYKSGFPLNEIAIIYAKHKQARNIISLLEKKGIPYNTKRRVNILDLPLIQNIRTFLQYLSLENARPYSGEHLLYRIMHFEFLGIPTHELAQLSYQLATGKKESRQFWRDVIADKESLMEMGIKNPENIIRFSVLINELIGNYSNYTLPILIERINNRSGLLQYIIQHEEKAWLLQLLTTFFDFVKKETDRNPRLTLKRLLDIFKNMDDNRLSIGVNKDIYAGNGVNLVTAHSSKGLEYQYVYIIDSVKDNWEPSKGGGNFHFPFPDTLTFSGEEDAMEARRRLFYVAMTRAQERLYISYSDVNEAGKNLQRSCFIDEMTSGTYGLEIETRNLDRAALLEAQQLELMATEKPKILSPGKDKIEALLEGFALSVSSLNRYLRCPLSFYYENILRIPSVTSEAASYGLAMHFALRRIFEKMEASKTKSFPEVAEFVLHFEDELKRNRANFTRKEYERRLNMGRRNLPKYYEQNIAIWPKKTLPEYDVRNVEVDGVPLTGTIDLVELHKNNIAHIVDYKTGTTDKSKLRRPTKANPLGGIYYRQLVFYKILFESDLMQASEIRSAEIAYLEPDSKGIFLDRQIEINSKDVTLVRTMIKNSYKGIMRHDFYEGCGEKNCQWCNFVKHNIMVDSFVDKEIELLDDK